MFYKATVQAVLLFGSKIWCLSMAALKRLEGFHLKSAWQMAEENQPRQGPDGVWTYPATEDVLEEVGLHTIVHYMDVRRTSIARYISDRPILWHCREGV